MTTKTELRRQRITQPEMLMTPAEPLPPTPGEPQPAEGSASLADMLVKMRLLAESWPGTAGELDAMYREQVATAIDALARLTGVVERNKARLTSPDDPHWQEWYGQEAKRLYAEETVLLLNSRGHSLFCETHGPPGLSYRGLVTGEGPLAWSRPCLECAGPQIAAEKLRLWKEHKR